MNEKGFARRMVYMIAGCGMILFAVFGFFPGSNLGGVLGLNVARILLGLPVSRDLLSRWLVAASMAMGVMVSGIMFITAVSITGWLISTALYALSERRRILPSQQLEKTDDL